MVVVSVLVFAAGLWLVGWTAGWRVNYDTVLLQLAEITQAPYAQWTADRSAVSRERPMMRRFGRRAGAGPGG